VLGFKGGTALKRCYFGDYRFSEDLDFTLTAHVTPEELKARLEPVYTAVRDASGIVFAFDREDRQKHDNSYTFYLRYEGPLPRGNDVKVDITLREMLVYPLRERVVLRGYEEFSDLPEDRRMLVYSLEEIASEKNPGARRQRRATNRETSTICGTSRRTKASSLGHSPMRCGKNWSFAGSRARAWPTPSAPRRQG
jgi:predicted nucleotidyltransferase component of viral defense system